MNTYRPLLTEAGYWVVGWWINDIWQAPVWGAFATESEAAFYTYSLAKMELDDWRGRPIKPEA
jgi:hypothetical protein